MFLFFYVGARRLELPTPCTPCKCASQLRHAPIFENNLLFFGLQKYYKFSEWQNFFYQKSVTRVLLHNK